MGRNTYPHDPRDPGLRRCARCGDRYMPPAFCETHARTCRTCCSRLGLPCGIRAATEAVKGLAAKLSASGDTMEGAAESAAAAADAYRAAVQADVDALYGPEGDR